jgi:hypothetical protein
VVAARGVVADVAEAFGRYLSSGRPAYVPAPSVSVGDAVALAAKAGGVAVLAHPGRLAAAERNRVLGEALEAGIDGIEVWYSSATPSCAPPLRLGRAAPPAGHQRLRHHGRHKPDVHLSTGAGGNLAVPRELLDAIRHRLAAGGPG